MGFYIVRETSRKWVTGTREGGYWARGKVGNKGIAEPAMEPFGSGSRGRRELSSNESPSGLNLGLRYLFVPSRFPLGFLKRIFGSEKNYLCDIGSKNHGVSALLSIGAMRAG